MGKIKENIKGKGLQKFFSLAALVILILAFSLLYVNSTIKKTVQMKYTFFFEQSFYLL